MPKVLIVEDEEAIAVALRDGFSFEGYDVRLARDGVRVNAVCPGFVDTYLTRGIAADAELYDKVANLHPMGRFARPVEVANVILFLASDEASFVTAAAWAVDGGYTAI